MESVLPSGKVRVDVKHVKSKSKCKKLLLVLGLFLSLLIVFPILLIVMPVGLLLFKVIRPRQWNNCIRDIKFLKLMSAGGIQMKKIANRKDKGEWSAIHVFMEAVDKFGNQPNIMYLDKTYTFCEVDDWSNKVANWAHSVGIRQGDTVAVDLPNKPEVLIVFIAMLKIGVTTAMLNNNIKGKGLVHCASTCGANKIIYDVETKPLVEELNAVEGDKYEYYYLGDEDRDAKMGKWIDLENSPSTSIPHRYRDKVVITDLACHIYTSGTTGLPKAAKIPHLR